MNSYTIGIDIGGTNTDAVLVDTEQKIVAKVKTPTTSDIATGFSQALKELLEKSTVDVTDIRALFLGTTHATNAILQKKDLYRVGLLRIAGHNPETLPPCFDWPEDLTQALFVGHVTVGGGYECDSRPITPFSIPEVRRSVETLISQGAESLAVIGVFSPQNPEQELEARKVIAEVAGEQFPVSLSHQIGGVGFIERENSTILNAALKRVMAQGFRDLESVCRERGLNCPLFITQNNGTIIDLAHALDYPVLTISAGPTNSFIGASRLTGLSDALIVDIGGTSTDIGLIKKGFPRRSLNTSNIGGVKLNFPMPDVLSLGLGGGSHVDQNSLKIGPKSVGKDILTRAHCFGGDCFTFTDAAVAYGVPISGTNLEKVPCCAEDAEKILRKALENIERELLFLEGGKRDLPVLFVGGGATLFPKEMLENRYHVPEDANVANAYGAALAEMSGTVDRVVSLTQREAVLAELHEEARQAAIQRGADATSVEVIDVQIIPYHYVPNQIARVIVTAAGKQAR